MKSFTLLVFSLIFAFVNAQSGQPSAKLQNVKVETISNKTSDMVTQTTAEGIPDPPGRVMCEAISSTEIRVSWENLPSESIHGIFKSYKVSYATNHQFYIEKKLDHKITTANETVLNGLEKYHNYAINVLASNSLHDGHRSENIDCRTKEDVPDEPVDFRVRASGTENKVLVLWYHPLQPNGEIVYYTIYYRKISGGKVKTGKVLPSQPIYEIFGLESNKLYEIWMTASTKAGEGLSSEYAFVTPREGTPAKIATYNETFTVKFKENVVLPCDADGLPTPDVTWKVNDDNLIPNERLQISANGTLIIQSVLREDANNYTCFAKNAFGNDSITHKLIVRAPPKAPKLTMLSSTTNEILLRLKPFSTDPEPSYGFDLHYKLNSEIEDWQNLKVDVGLPAYRIEHCICGSSYLIYAFGHNDLGDGDASDILKVRTKGSKPVAPASTDFIEPSTDSVTLHLSAWKADSCPISHFFVEFKEKSSIRWVKIRNKLQPNTDFVLNLEAATLYDIRVTAHNAAGTTLADYAIAKLTGHEGTVAPPNNITDLSDTEKI